MNFELVHVESELSQHYVLKQDTEPKLLLMSRSAPCMAPSAISVCVCVCVCVCVSLCVCVCVCVCVCEWVNVL